MITANNWCSADPLFITATLPEYFAYISGDLEAEPSNTDVIVDVEMVVPDKVVKVYFDDGSYEKAVCQEPDVFSLEQAIGICVSKHVMGGSGRYNNTIKRGMRLYQTKLNAEAVMKAEEERIAKRREKRLAYKEKCKKKRLEEEAKLEEEKREAEIAIQTEAYIRAMEYMRQLKTEE